MTILFVGGGSLGPVTPLLATAKVLRRKYPSLRLEWVGTPSGPERGFVEAEGISFCSLPVVKFPRYPSWQWLRLPWDWLRARQLAERLVERIRPEAVVTAGGFTAVPIILSAVRRGIPCAAHQLDLVPGLTNKRIARLCTSVTTSFEYKHPPFGEDVSDEHIATPVRFSVSDLPERDQAARYFSLHASKPIVLFIGGGTGARRLNQHLARTWLQWSDFTQVIHLTGRGQEKVETRDRGYRSYDLLDKKNLLQAYAAADVVVSRAGIGALSELAALQKATVFVPLPDSPQEANAAACEERGAALVFSQSSSTFDDDLLTTVRLLLTDTKERRRLGRTLSLAFPTDDGSMLAERICAILKKTP